MSILRRKYGRNKLYFASVSGRKLTKPWNISVGITEASTYIQTEDKWAVIQGYSRFS
jgi:hypothetical protein